MPALRSHAAPILTISRRSQRRAVVQSRETVAAETASASEVSSIERPAKKTEFDHAALAFIQLRQTCESFVQQEHIHIPLLRNAQSLIQGNVANAGAALDGTAVARVLYQNFPHQPGCNRKEMATILQVRRRLASQPNIGFMHKRCAL